MNINNKLSVRYAVTTVAIIALCLLAIFALTTGITQNEMLDVSNFLHFGQ
jgi:hypothetical protein